MENTPSIDGSRTARNADQLSIAGSNKSYLHKLTRNASVGKLNEKRQVMILENGLSPDLQNRINQYLLKNIGPQGYEKLKQKQGNSTYRVFIFKFILTYLIRKFWRYPDQAFGTFDFHGNGYVTYESICNHSLVYRTPFTKKELLDYLKTESAFRAKPQMNLEIFTKWAYNDGQKKIRRESESSDDTIAKDEEKQKRMENLPDNLSSLQGTSLLRGGNSSSGYKENGSMGTTNISLNTKSKILQKKIGEIEVQLMKKLQINFKNVRKAFLELDQNSDGYIEGEDLAKYLKNITLGDQEKLDYSMLELLIKLRCNQTTTRINYNSFCAWLGSAIEPIEAFYFRHDSHRNPQYDLNMKKSVQPNLKTQKQIREILTGSSQNLKDMFIKKIRLQYKTLKKAFSELDRRKQGHITLDSFIEIIEKWGFEAKKEHVEKIFDWLDHDKDQKISFMDLRNSVGLEILPQETFFFRQDVKQQKKPICDYEDCWENNTYNQKSAYCPLHQKIIKNYTIDLFDKISQMIDDDNWKLFTESLQATRNIISLENLTVLVHKHSNYHLSKKDQEFVFETFKSLYDDKGKLIREFTDEKYVMLNRLDRARKQMRVKKIQDILSLEENEAHVADAARFKGLIHADDNFLMNMALANVKGWKDIWREIRKIDLDKNGLIEINDLESMMRDYFPDHLEGKSLFYYFRQFAVTYDKNLINYKPIKTMVDKDVAQKLQDIRDGRMTPKSMLSTPQKEQPGVLNLDNLSKLNQIVRSRSNINMDQRTLLTERASTQHSAIKSVVREQTIRSISRNQEEKSDYQIIRNRSVQNILQKQNLPTLNIKKKMYDQVSQSQASTINVNRKEKLNQDLRSRLKVSWRKTYRAILKIDHDKTGLIKCAKFSEILHSQGCFISREELLRLAQSFGNTPLKKENIEDIQNDYTTLIDYEKLSKDMGLHHSYLEFIRNNQLDNESKGALISMRGGKNKYTELLMKKIDSSGLNLPQL